MKVERAAIVDRTIGFNSFCGAKSGHPDDIALLGGHESFSFTINGTVRPRFRPVGPHASLLDTENASFGLERHFQGNFTAIRRQYAYSRSPALLFKQNFT